MKWVYVIMLAFTPVIVSSLLKAFPVWLLWNWLCTSLFGLPSITFFEALGLTLLCSCLFQGSSNVADKSD